MSTQLQHQTGGQGGHPCTRCGLRYLSVTAYIPCFEEGDTLATWQARHQDTLDACPPGSISDILRSKPKLHPNAPEKVWLVHDATSDSWDEAGVQDGTLGVLFTRADTVDRLLLQAKEDARLEVLAAFDRGWNLNREQLRDTIRAFLTP
jgi:hypothetical protein